MAQDEKQKPDTSELNDEINENQLEPLKLAFGAEVSPNAISYRAAPSAPPRGVGGSAAPAWIRSSAWTFMMTSSWGAARSRWSRTA